MLCSPVRRDTKASAGLFWKAADVSRAQDCALTSDREHWIEGVEPCMIGSWITLLFGPKSQSKH